MKLALLGGGSIASAVARAAGDGRLPGVEIVGVAGSAWPPSERVRRTAELAGAEPCAPDDLGAREPSWVLEAAGGAAARQHLPGLLEAGVDAIVMSVGAMLDPDLERAVEAARRRGNRVLLPSGAIGGLDAVAAMNALGGIERARITTTKKPAGLAGAPHLERHGITLPEDERLVVFEGSVREAVAGFPANVNVAAALGLAGIGPERTEVRVVSDPSAARTRHEIEVEGSAGSVHVEILANPNPDNPRSSYLAALSAIAAVRSVC